MTLKLVAVGGEPVPESTLVDEVKEFAQGIETGAHGDVAGAVAIVVQSDGCLKICWFGEDYSPYELMGLLEAAKLTVFSDDVAED